MDNYTKICIGRMELDKVKNIVREVKRIYSYLDNVWPNGQRSLLPNVQVTKDRNEQYYIVINKTALSYLFIFMSSISSQLEKEDKLPPMPPDFLIVDHSETE